MLNNSLFICYSTPNYSPLTNLFLDSLRDIGVQDFQIRHHLDPLDHLDVTERINPPSGFKTELWYHCVMNKIKHLIRVLSQSNINNRYFIFTDCDIRFFSKNVDQWNSLETFLCSSFTKDIFFMREGDSSDVNTGFFIIKNNDRLPNMISFFTRVVEIMSTSTKKDMEFGDQTIINRMKQELEYECIPNDYVAFGKHIYNVDHVLFHHAVCCYTIQQKLVQMEEVKKNIDSKS
jgi:hypothetical protein